MFHRSTLFFLLMLSTGLAFAQTFTNTDRDRLLTALHNAAPDTGRVACLLRLSYFYLAKPGEEKNDLDSATLLAAQADALARTLHFTKGREDAAFMTWHIRIEANDTVHILERIANLSDTSRLKVLLEITMYKISIFKEQKENCNRVLRLAYRLQITCNNPRLRYEYKNVLGIYYLTSEEKEKGIALCLEAIHYCNTIGDRQEAMYLTHRTISFVHTDYYVPGFREYNQQAGELYQATGDSAAASICFHNMGWNAYEEGDMIGAVRAFTKAIQLLRAGDREIHDDCYQGIARAELYAGDFNKALFHALRALESQEAAGDTLTHAGIYGYLADIYLELGETDKSILTYRKILRICDRKKDPDMQVGVTRKLIVALIKANKLTDAYTIIKNAEDRLPAYKDGQKMFIFSGMGAYYNAIKKYDLAEKYFLLSSEYGRKDREPMYTSLSNLTIGSFYAERKQYRKAGAYLQGMLNPGNHVPVASFVKRNVHHILFEVDSAAGNFLSAIRHLQEYNMLEDSLTGLAKSSAYEKLLLEYETEEKDRTLVARDKDIQLQKQSIELLTRQGQIQQTRLHEAKAARNMTIAGVAMMLLLVTLTYNRYRLKKRSNRMLEAQQIEISRKNGDLRNLLTEKDHLLAEKEGLLQEKDWLVKEIHHRVKNNLQIVISLLNTQSSYLDNQIALSAIRQSEHRMRVISLIHQKLYLAKDVSMVNMVEYIHQLVSYLREVFLADQRIRIRLDIDPIHLGISRVVPVGLIINEAVTNCIKYAFPNPSRGMILISLKEEEHNDCVLTISDDGIGLSEDLVVGEIGSMGMGLIETMYEQLDGTGVITNDNGTTWQIRFPNGQQKNILHATPQYGKSYSHS